ncbi:hypothetical protein BCR43DRAFT_518791 [Syncephalastrum racemosum]|uniref:ISXO2-like transposase domain-containing protein n=1 Tax=Syncephalastrum racemosum TaxID=13706 RepID=A0A1X2H1Z7_SYNRA|nr:hypothetical protein BCR43DRAFT_518791 [Syncephalastrum racemosum]
MDAYDFVRVNHSEHYRGPDMDGYHPGETFDTNMIEGMWSNVKAKVTPRQRTYKAMPWKLLEFLWHWKHKRDRWYSMVKCLEKTHFSSTINRTGVPTIRIPASRRDDAVGLPTRAPGEYRRQRPLLTPEATEGIQEQAEGEEVLVTGAHDEESPEERARTLHELGTALAAIQGVRRRHEDN